MRRDKHVLLFDSDCPMCTFQSRTLGWLDWFGCVEMIPLKDTRAQKIAPDITREDLLEAIHCITPEGEIHRGARAIRFLGMRVPLSLASRDHLDRGKILRFRFTQPTLLQQDLRLQRRLRHYAGEKRKSGLLRLEGIFDSLFSDDKSRLFGGAGLLLFCC